MLCEAFMGVKRWAEAAGSWPPATDRGKGVESLTARPAGLPPVIVVSDSGPLIALAKIDALPVLVGLYSEILIPPSVLEETVGAGLRLGVVDAQAVEARRLGKRASPLGPT
jgi:hypothetical protein